MLVLALSLVLYMQKMLFKHTNGDMTHEEHYTSLTLVDDHGVK